VIVTELELDLDAFEGPFDLLLALVLKEELDLRDVDLAAIVTAFLERLAEREELDLEACGEFLVLIAALLELKARALFPDEAALAELERRGLAVRRWPARHHYFGGVSAVGRAGPAADPRRSGSAGTVPVDDSR